jgi:hypothetical protein
MTGVEIHRIYIEALGILKKKDPLKMGENNQKPSARKMTLSHTITSVRVCITIIFFESVINPVLFDIDGR